MSLFDWLEIASHLARLIMAIASMVLGFISIKHWAHGDLSKATIYIAWAIFLRPTA